MIELEEMVETTGDRPVAQPIGRRARMAEGGF